MRACIHRGTRQIGGTCVELESQGQRIALDIGLPLDADSDAEALLPPVPGFREPDVSLMGVLVSHPHQDHYGLARFARSDLPVFIGAAADRILKAAALFTPSGANFTNVSHLRDREPLEIGPFTVTPHLVDHSAYDAYSLLVEADGKRLLYSGDFRGHGRKSALFERMLRQPPKDIDVLLMEGSSIGRLNDDASFPSEEDLEIELAQLMQATPGLVLAYASGQNIDRIVTLFRACKRTGRKLIIDLYTAEILRATENAKVPQGWWDGIRVFLPYRQRVWVKRKELFDLIPRYKANRIFAEELKEIAPQATMLFRPSMTEDMVRAECLGNAHVVWSMWDGYLKDESSRPFLEWMTEYRLPITKIHTSGHASVADLKRFAAAISPRCMVPIQLQRRQVSRAFRRRRSKGGR